MTYLKARRLHRLQTGYEQWNVMWNVNSLAGQMLSTDGGSFVIIKDG